MMSKTFCSLILSLSDIKTGSIDKNPCSFKFPKISLATLEYDEAQRGNYIICD